MPANDYIKIDLTNTAATEAQTLKSAIRQLQLAKEQLTAVLDKMNHNSTGTAWTSLEALYGLPTGKGQTTYDLINGTVGAMNGTFQNNNAVTLIAGVG